MPFETPINNEFVRPSVVTRYRSELKRSSKRYQTSKIEKPKFQDKLEIENPFGQPHIQLYPEIDQNVHGEIVFQKKHLGNQRKHPIRSKASSKDDELVKHMSNLPGYLQRMDNGERLQEKKALNFGVLDWESLEKWKHKQTSMPARHSMNSSSTSTNASSAFRTVGKSIRSGNVGSLSHRIKPFRGESIGLQDYKHGQKLLRTTKSFGDNSSVVAVEKEKKKDVDQRICSETGASSSESSTYGFTRSSNKKELQDLDFEFPSPCCPDKHQNIVLLLPRDSPRNSCSELLRTSELRSSVDQETMSMSRKSFSDAFCPRKGYPDELYSAVSHSGPLPCRAETNSMRSTEKPILRTEGKSTQENKSKAKVLTNSTLCEATKRLDREFADMTAGKGRSASPNRRFGIGIGRMSRSSSWKESSAAPQLISSFIAVKSGPLKLESSYNPNSANGEKAQTCGKGRSSPLRRLLDPILKPKVANTHCANTRPLQGNLNSLTSEPSSSGVSVLIGKQVPSSVHALLRLTVKNGLPLFKFVVDDNDSDILATTVKKFTQSGKDYSSWVYTFYSVHETKRKKKGGGWINQASKEKSCGYAYNVVGQMKVSSSKDRTLAKESILFGVELERANREVPARAPNRELAAIVTNSKSRSCTGEVSDQHSEFFSEDGCFSGENLHNHTTVILPDGIHGLPNEGAPSPLTDRWKSGGSCDCGGWDIGCKLRVLTSPNACHMALGLSKACPTTDHFSLFVQGRNQDDKPIFSLAPLKSGIYSVKFNSSISSLQAFSICVAVMNCEELSDLSGAGPVSETRQFPSPTSAGLRKTSPVRYVSYPPYSPVGRA